MFCEKCGNQLPEDALFCDRCGNRVFIFAGGRGEKWETLATPILRYMKRLVLGAAIFMILAWAVYTKLEEYTSPEHVAKSFFEAVMEGDAKTAYHLLDIEEDSEFINEKYFGKLIKNIGEQNVRNYQMKLDKTRGNNTDDKQNFDITYQRKEDSRDISFYIRLEKTSSKKFLFFDSWKVNTRTYIGEYVEVAVYRGTEVQLDGKELSAGYLSETKKNINEDRYVIPKMFCGTYDVWLSGGIYTDTEMILNVDGGDRDHYLARVERVDGAEDMTLQPQLIEEVKKLSKEHFRILWSNAAQQTGFEDVKDVRMEEKKYKVKEEYERLAERFHKEDGAGLQEVNFGNLDITAENVSDKYIEDPLVQITFSAPFSAISQSRNWRNGKLEEKESSGKYHGNMTYVYQSGKWALHDMLIADFYY